MPFPPKQVFIDYLNLYYSVRAEERASWSTLLKSGAESLASYVTGTSPVVKQLDSHLTTMEAAIKAAADFDDWFRLVFTLRKTAGECQDAKWANGISLSCLVLHGTASLILRELHNSDEFKDKLDEEITKRTKRIEDLKKNKKTSLTVKNGQSVNDYNDEIKKLISELAQLSEISYVEKAAKYNLFGYLPQRKEVDIITYTEGKGNRVGLIELQLNFCEWLYASTFQKTKKHIGFSEFLQDSDKAYKLILAQQEKAKQRSTNVEAAAAAAAATDSSSVTDTAPADNSNTDSHSDISSASSAAAAAAAASSSSSLSTVTSSSPGTTGMFSPSAATSKRKATRQSTANDDAPASAAAVAATPRRTNQ